MRITPKFIQNLLYQNQQKLESLLSTLGTTLQTPSNIKLSTGEAAWKGNSSFENYSSYNPVQLSATSTAGNESTTTLSEQYATYKTIDGQYKIHNNIWGMDQPGADSSQTVDVTDGGTSRGFTVHGNHSGDIGAVKSYPFIGTGWHFGEVVGDKLPLSLESAGDIKTSVNYSLPANTKGNFAEEAWLFPPGNNNPKDPEGGMELMVRHAQNELGVPGDKLASDITVGKNTYDVYYLPKMGCTGAQFLNFVEKDADGKTGDHTATTDWKALIDLSTNPNGELYQLIKEKADAANVKTMEKNWTMLGLECGFEITNGGEGCKVEDYQSTIIDNSKFVS